MVLRYEGGYECLLRTDDLVYEVTTASAYMVCMEPCSLTRLSSKVLMGHLVAQFIYNVQSAASASR